MPPRTTASFTWKQLLRYGLTMLWFIGAAYFKDQMYFIVSAIVFIFLNLGARRAGQDSAYAIFNDGGRHLLGELRADQVATHCCLIS